MICRSISPAKHVISTNHAGCWVQPGQSLAYRCYTTVFSKGANMGCSICENLTPATLASLKHGQTALIWLDPPGLAKSATSQACNECCLLSSAIGLWHPKWADDAHRWPALRLEMAVDKPLQLKYRPYGVEGGNDIQLFRVPSDNASSCSLPPSIGPGPNIPQSSGSSESIAKIVDWHHLCKTSHELCSSYPSTLLPTRLLDVGYVDPKLTSTATMPSTAYIALSYCWGDPKHHPVVKTLSSNVIGHEAGIPFHSLPPALADAVLLTRKLSYRYIWIDALCIIQDDADDWLREAATMCRVYSLAALTIIASRSDGTGSGIFGDQSFHHYQTVPYKNKLVAVRTNIARQHEHNIVVPLRDDPDPISRRAWTFQEAVLSNCAIHITSEELRWECNTWQRCQCGYFDKKLPLKYDPEYFGYEHYRTWRLDDFFPITSIEDAYELWAIMVTNYTKRSLTNENDRLVAFSGLARRFHEVMQKNFSRKEVYLAGLWKEDLPHQLLWRVESIKKHERPKAWRAPSWSWASMEATVDPIPRGRFRSSIEILEANIETIGSDPFSGLKSAMLRLRAPILHGVHFKYDPHAEQWSRFPSVKYQKHDLRVALSYVDNDRDGETDKYLTDPGQNFDLLVIGYAKSSDTHECMVIVPVAGKTNCFERIGLIRLGQHLREPKEHALAIESAPACDVTLL